MSFSCYFQEAECYRSAIDLTNKLLQTQGQGPGKANSPSQHSPFSLQVSSRCACFLLSLRRCGPSASKTHLWFWCSSLYLCDTCSRFTCSPGIAQMFGLALVLKHVVMRNAAFWIRSRFTCAHIIAQVCFPIIAQVWLTRVSLLVKLRLYSQAESELQAFGSLDKPDLYYEFYPDAFAGRRGACVDACMRARVRAWELV